MQVKAVERYKDDLLDKFSSRHVDQYHGANENMASSEITKEAKFRGEELIKNIMREIIDDDTFSNDFFCKLVTEPKRARMNCPLTLLDEYEDG